MLESEHIDRFLEERWQKKSGFLSAAMEHQLPQLSPGELAWLATLPDVESRLVFTERDGENLRYRVESGPFEEAQLSTLPDEDWTLLVQDVEKHLPDFRAYLGQAHFIPDWRIDDLMVSCAAPGGSVGPHVDNYDVFLCQGEGTREWQVGYAGQFEEDPDTSGLALVRPFPLADSYQAQTGDVLYLPPGVPHWGVASDLCTTYSIGCRAPGRHELELGQERVLGKPVSAAAGSDDKVFYVDPDLAVSESRPGCIDSVTLQRVRQQQILDPALSDIDLARIFGCVVTDPKAWLNPEPLDQRSLFGLLQKSSGVEVHGMARIAWIESGEHRLVFVNGIDREIDESQLRLVQNLCASRRLSGSAASVTELRKSHDELIGWFCREGLFDADYSQE